VIEGTSRTRASARQLLRAQLCQRLFNHRRSCSTAVILALVFAFSAFAHAQVAVDATTSNAAELTAAANTLSFPHTTTGTNLVLVVGVSMNISQQANAVVGSVTYNGVGLISAGTGISNGTVRTEMWYLVSPPTGTNTIVVTVNNIGARPAHTVGTVAGATTFTGADPTKPIRTYVTNSGNSTNAFVNVTSSSNDVVLDTLALVSGTTASITSPVQTQRWALASTGGTHDAYGFGSTRPGAASVPMSENLSATAAWADAAVSVEPFQADLGLSITGSKGNFPANLAYTVIVTNNGPSGGAAAVVTLTMPAGTTLVAATPSQGSCTGTVTVTCSLGGIPSGNTATIAVAATPTAPGGYVLNGSVTAATPDLNSSNNSASAVAYSSLASCATTTGTAGGTLTGVINTYYPGTATVTSGQTSISLGAATGSTAPIAIGDLVLVMQMQDAAINSTNSSQYGDGVSGSGSTSLNNAGVYEYATATSAVPLTGGTLTVAAAGPGGGLLYTYTAAAASVTQGARRFQVIRVPNYSSATLSSTLAASAWNGATGGVLALNVAGTLTLGGANISVNGQGFQGAAGLQLNGATGAANSDFLFTSPATYTTGGAPFAGADGSKGEGIAGTPHWIESGGTVVSSAQAYAEGYPNGSMARGAPGNAGGGGTDGDPVANDQNSGGGGGGNGGMGGQGGNTWNTNLSSGGYGGAAFPASVGRVVMGGGGGAGSRNNSTGDAQASSGAAGGGIVMIRATTITGNATITANGAAAYNATSNDGGGGGGAGGSIVFLWNNFTGAAPVITLDANGGRGGDAWDGGAFSNANRHGPGGGGGGGVLVYTGIGAFVTATVTGGGSGITLNTAGVTYGASAGASGTSTANVTLDSSPGPRSGVACTDLSVTKTGVPNPVVVNKTLTYTITVSNISAVAAGNVQVVDSIPAQVVYVSSSFSGGTGGSCSQSSGVLTCTFSSIAAGATATITVTTTASAPYTLAVNTAVANSTTLDSNTTNNTATASVPIEGPTAVRVNSFDASSGAGEVVLSWNTGGELHNLGFNVYREVGGQRVQLNPSLIAGSALLMRESLEQHAARTYGWIDPAPVTGAVYWLEDVDLNGTRTMHGPISIQNTPVLSAKPMVFAPTMRELAQPRTVSPVKATAAVMSAQTAPKLLVRERATKPITTAETQRVGFELAARPALKILVDHEGWYSVTQQQLSAAGFSLTPDSMLHLFAEGVEQPIRIVGAGPQSAIEFYGTAIDTAYSGQRVYWLTSLNRPGERVETAPAAGTGAPQAPSFPETIELKPRTTYFSGLLRENTDNFFGPVVTSASTTQSFNVANLAHGPVLMHVVLQGVTSGQEHDVTVALNGSTLGDVNFSGQLEGDTRFTVPDGVLLAGNNTITLTSQQGALDVSLVDYIDVTYQHTYNADSDQLKFSAAVGSNVTVGGFTQIPTRLIDVTNPQQPLLVPFQTTAQGGMYSLSAQVPWTSGATHWLIAMTDAQISSPVSLVPHTPSNLHSPQRGADVVMLTAPQFVGQMLPLANLRQSQGKSVALVTTDQVYDEFNFGEPTPYAVRNFLATASAMWRQKPRYLLLGGDASLDPRNYLGFGDLDFVPTKIIPTAELKTASDDWFSDFNNTGFPEIATGRLPARTSGDAQTMVGKILTYASGQSGSWTNQSMLVAGIDDPSTSFTQTAQSVGKLLPSNMNLTNVFVSAIGAGAARQNIIAGINAGNLLVNYNGHGSVQVWGSNIFDDTAASTLTNGTKLPFVVAMNCLNGFFHDVYTESLASALMLSKNGGAVAVWASSGLTPPDPQFQMDLALMKNLFTVPGVTLGDAVVQAKSGISDIDVRRTFILFGDPLTRLNWSSSAGSATSTFPPVRTNWRSETNALTLPKSVSTSGR
jgi:uncharacterized repeat protein (TIGR01451 family)